MVKKPRPVFVALVVLALGGAAAWYYLSDSGSTPAGAAVAGAPEPRPEPSLPRIGLARLDTPRGDERAGSRDLFRFGQAPVTSPESSRPAPPPASPSESAAVSTDLQAPPPTTLPPFAVKYVGAVEQKGVKVAVLLSDDKKEVLTGREGETVANRLKIVKIGLESVDVQDLGSERVRRIPLRGN